MKDNTLNAAMIITIVLVGIFSIWVFDKYKPEERTSSFVGYSKDCWQIGDTLTIVTAKGDTVMLDVSSLEGVE